MNEAKRQLVQSWLPKARRDLASARVLAANVEPLRDTAIYHCQQAGEKVVKGFLAFHDYEIERFHDVEKLIRSAIPCESQFASWVGVGRLLTPYATFFRYPGVTEEPSAEQYERAISAATALYEFVLSLLPEEVYPES
ncbi:MAG: HEPN domain-containing protein [Chloroflexi bacterium]|nr:HEPN domain-containing protein [Chloroflexota bacterium]